MCIRDRYRTDTAVVATPLTLLHLSLRFWTLHVIERDTVVVSEDVELESYNHELRCLEINKYHIKVPYVVK